MALIHRNNSGRGPIQPSDFQRLPLWSERFETIITITI